MSVLWFCVHITFGIHINSIHINSIHIFSIIFSIHSTFQLLGVCDCAIT